MVKRVNIFRRFRAAWKAALPMGGFGGGIGGVRSFFYGLLPGARVDYRQLAGNLWENSIVAAAINWIGRNLPQAPACIYTTDSAGVEHDVPHHPLTALLNRPNPFYGGRVLRQAIFLSLIVAGNAYVYIVRDNLGKPKELWYLPHFQVSPEWSNDATTENWITGYAYTQRGQTISLPFADVIHYREGIDPLNPRLGLSPLASAFRGVVTDNEADGYAAALLKNMGIPGALITPKSDTQTFTQSAKEELKEEYTEATGGDNRGRPMVLSGPIEVKTLAMSPEQLLLKTAQDRPEARICALIGINPVVLGLTVGLEHSTYSNMEEARASAWEDGIIPRLDLINSEHDTQLLPFLGDPDTENCGSDYRKVRALQESDTEIYQRLSDAVGGPFLTPNEARAKLGYDDIAGGEKLYPPKSAAKPAPDDGPSGTAATPPKPGDPEDGAND